MRRNRLPALVIFALCAVGAGSLLNVPNAWAVVQRAVKLIAGSGVSVSASDNATTGQQEWTVNSTVTGGVSSVNGSGGTFSCPTTTGAASCTLGASGVTAATYGDSTHVMSCSVNAEGQATSCSNVAISSGGGTLTSSSVTGNGFWTSNTSVLDATANILGGEFSCGTPSGHVWPCSLTASGVTAATYGDATHSAQIAINAEGRITSATNVSISGGSGGPSVTGTGEWYSITGSLNPAAITFDGDVSQGALSGTNVPMAVTRIQGTPVSATSPTAGQYLQLVGATWTPVTLAGSLVGRAVITTDLGLPSSGTLASWCHSVQATTTFNTVAQFASDSVTWASSASGTLSVAATPTNPNPPVFEISGTVAGDWVDIELEFGDLGGHQDEAMTLAYAFSSGAPTWPGGYTFVNTSSLVRGTAISASLSQITAHVHVASAGSGNLWVQPAVVNTITSVSSQTTQFGGNTALFVQDWR